MLQDHSRNRTPMPAAQPPAGATPPEPGPARAEAGIARILKAQALDDSGSHAALLTVSPETIPASIARARAVLDHALAVEAEHRRNGSKTDLPAAWHAACAAALDAFRLALQEKLKTQAGCHALARLTLDLREGLGLDLEEETVTVLQRIADGTSGATEDRRTRADEFLALMRKDGFAPYPAHKPQGLLPIDLAIPYEAERLLAIAQAEFDRHAEGYADLPPIERDGHLSRLQAQYRLKELAAVVRGPITPSALDDSTRAVLDAIHTHENAWQAYRRATAAYDAIGTAEGQTPASDEDLAAADHGAAEASHRSDQAWRDLFKARPQRLHDLWLLLRHIERHYRDHHGMENAPDIWGAVTGAVAAIRTASEAPAAQPHDLSKLSIPHLSRFYEICQQQREILLAIEGSSMCEARDGKGYNALGNIIETEGCRFAILGDEVVGELERREPADFWERNYILEARVSHHLRCNGAIEPELVAEITAAWGAK